ncbi:MAG TPA: DnaB-like helicase N-terminal domain-containing protein, partial [Bacillota bacterium]|nr:DnaB-like helicase N-terminal domain-containing protein [Bacillota bacterium]
MSDIWNDRTPPHNIEAEQAVIGAIFLEPEQFSATTEILQPEDFYRSSHQRIYQTMLKLSDNGEPIDLVTVTTLLSNEKTLDEAGGVSYLSDIAGSVPTAANIHYYCKIVSEKALLRRLIRTATNIVANGYQKEDDVDEVLNEAEKSILEVSHRKDAAAFKEIKDVLIEVYDNIEHLHHHNADVTGLATGYRDLDHITSGFQRNDLIIIAARPSVGKTAFA